MPYYRSVGRLPRKHHTVGGGYEELVGHDGFSGSSSLCYHRRSPSALVAVEAVQGPREALVANHPLLPRHTRPIKLPASGDPVTGRRVLAANAHCTLSWWSGGSGCSPLYRDAVGDEVDYLQSGSARLESTFGALDVAAGDYVVIPAGTVHRWDVQGPTELLLVEAAGGHLEVPPRYLTATGQFREGAPYSERDVRGPDAPLLVEDDGPAEILVRTRSGLTRHVLASHPFDVEGWDGCCYPWALAILDFEPITGRLHQPPPVHQTFLGPRFVVCSFVPRFFDFDPAAVKVPYHHSNVDCDEVLFYSQGAFMSRAGSGIGAGSMTIHPAGFTHGPQPGSAQRAASEARTEEVAVMIDTFDPLELSSDALSTEDPEYWKTWQVP